MGAARSRPFSPCGAHVLPLLSDVLPSYDMAMTSEKPAKFSPSREPLREPPSGQPFQGFRQLLRTGPPAGARSGSALVTDSTRTALTRARSI